MGVPSARANSAVGAEDQDFLAAERRRVPAHAGILGPTEDIARRPRNEHFRGDGQRSGGAGDMAADVIKGGIAGIQKLGVHVFQQFNVVRAFRVAAGLQERWCDEVGRVEIERTTGLNLRGSALLTDLREGRSSQPAGIRL